MNQKKWGEIFMYISLATALVFFSSRYSMYFFRSGNSINLFFALYISLICSVLFFACGMLNVKRGIFIALMAIQGVCSLVTLVFFAMNIANFPHFMNNLLEVLPLFAALLALYVFAYHASEIISHKKLLAIFGGGAAACLILLAVIYLPLRFSAESVVFDSGEKYTIEFITTRDSVGFVDISVDEETIRLYDESDGKKVSAKLHQIEVDKALLENADYQVGATKVGLYITNHTWFGVTRYGEARHFYKRSTSGARFLSVSDLHVQPRNAIALADSVRGDLDFIVALGDLLSFSGNERDLAMLVNYLAELSNGEIPVYFARGNHEVMGEGATNLIEYIPTPTDEFYYTFTFNDVFCIVNDFASDKTDDNVAVSGMTTSEEYRKNQAAFTSAAVSSAACKEASTVVSIVHIPFTIKNETLKANMARSLAALNEVADISISGHTHNFKINENVEGVAFPIVEDGGNKNVFGKNFVGTTVEIKDGKITVESRNKSGEVLSKNVFDVK